MMTPFYRRHPRITKTLFATMMLVSLSWPGTRATAQPSATAQAPTKATSQIYTVRDPRWKIDADHAIEASALSPDGRTTACLMQVGRRYQIWLWDLKTGKGRRLERPLMATGDWWDAYELTFSPDGRTLAALVPRGVGTLGKTAKTEKSSIELWEVKTGRRLKAAGQAGEVRSLRFTAGGRELVGATGNDVVWWSVPQCRVLRRQKVSATVGVMDFRVAPNGRDLVATEYDPNTDKAGKSPQFDFGLWDNQAKKWRWRQRVGGVMWHEFSPDGKQLLVGGFTMNMDGFLKIYTVATGKLMVTRSLKSTAVSPGSFDRTGRRVAILCTLTSNVHRNSYQVFSLHDLKPQSKSATVPSVQGVEFWPNDHTLAGITDEGKLHLWRID